MLEASGTAAVHEFRDVGADTSILWRVFSDMCRDSRDNCRAYHSTQRAKSTKRIRRNGPQNSSFSGDFFYTSAI